MTAPEINAESTWIHAAFPALSKTSMALFDNAGGTAPCRHAIDAVAAYQRDCPVQLGADYPLSVMAADRLGTAFADAGELLGLSETALPFDHQLVFGSSSTGLIDALARSLAQGWSAGDEIVVTNVDHEANIGAWRRLEALGFVIREWQLDDPSEPLTAATLATQLSSRTRLVAFTHASNILGNVTPLPALCAMVRDAGALSVIDGVGFAPHRSLDVADWGADFYVFSVYKVFGPHCAVLFGTETAWQQAGNINHSFHRDAPPSIRLAPGAFPYELAAGISGVARYLSELTTRLGATARRDTWDAIRAHEDHLCSGVLDALAALRDVRVIGAAQCTAERLPIVSFVVRGQSSESVSRALIDKGFAVRHGHFYAPRLLRYLDIEPADGVVRLSLTHYNTVAECHDFVHALGEVIAR
ncbi:MAG: aminotransferase class V-fold PLP-dependent enzyme [Pseudomonadota bacterium]